MTKVQGLDAFQKRFRSIPVEVRKAVATSMEQSAHDIVEDMFNVAPQGETLRLAGSIRWLWATQERGGLAIGRVAGRSYGAMRILIRAGDDDAFYARFQEFGTRMMAANPFFYPVWRARRRRTRTRISRAITKVIRGR